MSQHQAMGILPTREFFRDTDTVTARIIATLIGAMVATAVNQGVIDRVLAASVARFVTMSIVSGVFIVLALGIAERIVRRKEQR